MPLKSIKEIIQNTPKKSSFPKCLDKSDPRVNDIENYDLNSFDFGRGHKCAGIEIMKNYEAIPRKVQCELVKVDNHRGHLNFQFEINKKIYFYGCQGIKSDYSIVLCCTKSYQIGQSKSRNCSTYSFILPSESLKQIIQKSPRSSKYPKNFEKSDPKVFDIQNYDINSFVSYEDHKCPGTELSEYFENKTNKCKILGITHRRGHPHFHFEIDGKIYFYGIRGITANYKIILRCSKSQRCPTLSSILPFDFLKEIIYDKPIKSRFPKFFDKSDPKVYDIKSYEINSFELGLDHTCLGTELGVYENESWKSGILR